MTQDEAKGMVAKRAVEFVRDGMVVGLGSGSTSAMFIRELAARKLKIRCVASSDKSHELAASLGMEVHTLAELPELDVYIDGADELCTEHGELDLIKGGGGALLREKIVCSAAREFICVVDESKVVKMLGKFPLPVEVIQMALPLVEPKLVALGLNPKLRMKKGEPQGLKPLSSGGAGRPEAEASGYLEASASARSAGSIYREALSSPDVEAMASKEAARLADSENAGEPYVTDEGNYILDCACGGIAEPESTAAELKSIVGVVEHGLFLGMATLALVGGEGGVKELRG